MGSGTNFIFGSFEITGDHVERFIKCSFFVTDKPANMIQKEIGYKGGEGTGVYGQIGKITENNDQIVSNANVIARKDGYIYDKTITDKNGNYCLFLPDGTYDIEIQSHSINRLIKDYEVANGITEVKSDVVTGDIFAKSKDSVLFSYFDNDIVQPDSKSLVYGQILDIRDEPVVGAEIVISESSTDDTPNKNVVAYVKTDCEGKYRFLLLHATYDVRIRLPKQHVKIAKNVVYNGYDGLMPEVSKKLNK